MFLFLNMCYFPIWQSQMHPHMCLLVIQLCFLCVCIHIHVCDFADGSVVKNQPASARDVGSIPQSGRYPGGGHGNPLQSSCPENPMDRGACQATVHGVSKSQTWLTDFHFLCCSQVRFCPCAYPVSLWSTELEYGAGYFPAVSMSVRTWPPRNSPGTWVSWFGPWNSTFVCMLSHLNVKELFTLSKLPSKFSRSRHTSRAFNSLLSSAGIFDKWIICHFSFPNQMPFYFILGVCITACICCF